MAEATKIVYDVREAIDKLNQLNKKVTDAGKKAKKSFGGDSSKSVNIFDKRLKKLAGTMGATDFTAKGLFATFGGAGAVFGTAAAGVGLLISQFIDFDDLLRDSQTTLKGYNKALQSILNTRETVSTFGDVAINRDFRQTQRELSVRQGEANIRLAEIEAAREAANERLKPLQEELSRREALLRTAISVESSLRDRLARRLQDQQIGEFAGFDADTRSAKLNQAAREAANQGDLDRAEALEAAAAAAAKQADNQAFAQRDLAETQTLINSKLKAAIADQETAVDELQRQVTEQQGLVNQVQETLDLRQKEAAEIRRTNRLLRAQRRIVRTEAQATGETQTADSGARQFEKGARQFITGLDNSQRGLVESFKLLASTLSEFATDNADRVAVRNINEQAGFNAGLLSRVLRQVSRGEEVSIGELNDVIPAFESFTDAVARLQALEGRGELDGESINTLRSLENLDQALQTTFAGASQFRANRPDDRTISTGTSGFSREERAQLADDLVERILQSTSRASGTPSRATQAAPNDSAANRSQGAPNQVTAAPANINVNATVKGGIVDQEVTRTIAGLIRKELRKQTVENLA